MTNNSLWYFADGLDSNEHDRVSTLMAKERNLSLAANPIPYLQGFQVVFQARDVDTEIHSDIRIPST